MQLWMHIISPWRASAIDGIRTSDTQSTRSIIYHNFSFGPRCGSVILSVMSCCPRHNKRALRMTSVQVGRTFDVLGLPWWPAWCIIVLSHLDTILMRVRCVLTCVKINDVCLKVGKMTLGGRSGNSIIVGRIPGYPISQDLIVQGLKEVYARSTQVCPQYHSKNL